MNRHKRRVAKKQKQQQVTPLEAFQLAIQLHQQQRLDEAEKLYQAVLKVLPNHPDALHYYGVLLHQLGQSEQAVDYIRQALSYVPNYLDALNNLGNVLNEIGDKQGAVAAYHKVLELSPDHVGVHNNLGTALRHLKAYQESIALLNKALELSPNNPDVLQNLGNTYRANGDYQLAIDTYQKSLAIKPEQKVIYQRLWKLLLGTGQQAASEQVLAEWIKVDPDNHIARHHFLAHTGYMPERASDDYIQETFDRFASSFDYVLESLEYRAPSLISEKVAELFANTKLACVLDAGCGTGLSGIGLRNYANTLIGVDLSQGMLNKAQQRKIYDDLIKADLVNYLLAQTNRFNLIISADTLVYFGALETFLQAANQALNANGTLIFTVEKHEGDNGFQLNYHGRYAHTPRYITDCLTQAGFNLQSIDTVILRKEMGEPVTGLLINALLR